MKLPKHTGYFRRAFQEKYQVAPVKSHVVRINEADYTVFMIPATVVLDEEDKSYVLSQDDKVIELIVRTYNYKYADPSRFNEKGILKAPIRSVGPLGLNRKYVEAFKWTYKRIFGSDPVRCCVWRNMGTGETYAFYALPPDPKDVDGRDIDTITLAEIEYTGFLVRYRQLDRVPDSMFSEDGEKLNRGNVAEYDLPYAAIRRDTDDYRKDEPIEQRFERLQAEAAKARERFGDMSDEQRNARRIRNREAYRRKTGFYEKNRAQRVEKPTAFEIAATVAKPEELSDHDTLLMRERDLEMKDPISHEELEELEVIRQKLYGPGDMI